MRPHTFEFELRPDVNSNKASLQTQEEDTRALRTAKKSFKPFFMAASSWSSNASWLPNSTPKSSMSSLVLQFFPWKTFCRRPIKLRIPAMSSRGMSTSLPKDRMRRSEKSTKMSEALCWSPASASGMLSTSDLRAAWPSGTAGAKSGVASAAVTFGKLFIQDSSSSM